MAKSSKKSKFGLTNFKYKILEFKEEVDLLILDEKNEQYKKLISFHIPYSNGTYSIRRTFSMLISILIDKTINPAYHIIISLNHFHVEFYQGFFLKNLLKKSLKTK